MKQYEIDNTDRKVFATRIKPRKTTPDAPTFILGFDTEYYFPETDSSGYATPFGVSWQLSEGHGVGHFMPINRTTGRLTLEEITLACEDLREDRAPHTRLVVLAAWFAQAEMSVIQIGQDEDSIIPEVIYHGQNIGWKWEIPYSKRKKITYVLYDLTAFYGIKKLEKVAPADMPKLTWEHSSTTPDSVYDRQFQRYAMQDAHICHRLAADLHCEFARVAGFNPFQVSSAGRAASLIFQHHYLKSGIDQPIPKVRALALRGFRGSGDYGGIWQRGILEGDYAEYDGTGAFPAACASLEFLPRRNDWTPWKDGEAWPETGIYRAQFTWPEGNKYTLMTLIADERAIGGERYGYPRQGVDVFTGFELKAAEKLGAEIRIITGYWYEQGLSALPDMMREYTQARDHLKKSGREPLAGVYKSLLNSLIGKLAQHRPHTGVQFIMDEDRPVLSTTGDIYQSFGTVYAVEWWMLIIGKFRAAMMEVIQEKNAIHAQVDAVLIPDGTAEEFTAGGITFTRRARGNRLILPRRNTWLLENTDLPEDHPDRISKFAAYGGRNIPEIHAVMRAWTGEAMTHEYAVTDFLKARDAADTGLPLGARFTHNLKFKLPALKEGK